MKTPPFSGGESVLDREHSRTKNYSILLIDDDKLLLKLLKSVLAQENYNIVTCDDPVAALDILKSATFHLIISDYLMPKMNGGELLKQTRLIQPDSMRILLTASDDVDAVVSAVRAGSIYKFILKPWNDEDLRVNVALALEQYELIQKNKELQREKTERILEIEHLSVINTLPQSPLLLMLSKKRLLTPKQVRDLVTLQSEHKDADPAIKLIIERGWLTQKVIHEVIGHELKLQPTILDEFIVDFSVAALVPAMLCQHKLIIPLNVIGRRLNLAMADPLDSELLQNLRFITGLEIVPVLATIEAIQSKILEVYKIDAGSVADIEAAFGAPDPYEGIEIVIDEGRTDISFEESLQGDEPPAIRFVNAILLEALRLNASDIHIQPGTKNISVRLRVDGILIDRIQIPYGIYHSIVSRIKIMAELDISERRRPQDGRITVKTLKRIVDLRISTLPTLNGETIVIRILDRNSTVLSFDALGFGATELARIRYASDKPQGIILATGPTGSGKTTTLYSLLQHGATPDKNYITIEDPIEYYMAIAGQVLVREKIGLTFPLILRSILRQDPDVILIGEIRDLETAEVAFHAALTGHQVYSTLHSNSAFATLSRLFDLGLKPLVIASALEAVVAQRLVRRICNHCCITVAPNPELLDRLGGEFTLSIDSVKKGTGCNLCFNSGYKGRIGLYEVLLLDEHLRFLIGNQIPIIDLITYARSKGFISLREDAFSKVKQGITTLEEVFRVLGPA
ncbi:MAG: ATPase, T2SS/T4P/T4SS family [Pseudomonadota bacterium]